MTTHRLDIEQARRVAVHAQALSADRPTDLVNLVDQITLLQIDPTAAVAPNADLVAWSRLSSGWTHVRNVTQMLEFLMMRGEVASPVDRADRGCGT